jgi:3-deoxy-D-arabino-heptulosonate 7-phosphate (DAHP) synthase
MKDFYKIRGKFISQQGMAQLKRDEAALNGIIKRQKRKGYVTIVPCSCPNPDCAIPYIKEPIEVCMAKNLAPGRVNT